MKKCSKCKEIKEDVAFLTKKDTNKLQNPCKQCTAEKSKLKNENYKLNFNQVLFEKEFDKECRICKNIKKSFNFHMDKTRPDGRNYTCNDCVKENAKTRRKTNKNYLNTNKLWKINNKESYRDQQREYERKKDKTILFLN